jgi:ketosteroid isomerase-like protein
MRFVPCGILRVMPQENVEIVRRFEESWTKQDLDAALECVDAGMEFDWSDSMGPFRGTYKGYDGLAQFWTQMLDAWEHFSPQMEEAIDCGPERLITVDVVRARGKGSGIATEARGAMLWTLRDGKIVRAKMFQTKEEALKAAGLSD